LDGLNAAGLKKGQVEARYYYDAGQLAFIVADAAPNYLRKLRCCGVALLESFLTKLAEPISKKLWSSRISACASE